MMRIPSHHSHEATMALAESMMNMADDMERVLLGGGISLNILSAHVYIYDMCMCIYIHTFDAIYIYIHISIYMIVCIYTHIPVVYTIYTYRSC